MALNTHELAHGSLVFAAPGNNDIATVPAGERWVMRDANFHISSAAAGAIFRLGNRLSAINVPILSIAVVTDQTIATVERYVVFEAGANIRINAIVAGFACTYSVSGYKFTLP